MSGRWLEEHGFAIGSAVQVRVEQGRVTLLSAAWEKANPSPKATIADVADHVEHVMKVAAS